MEGGEEKTPAKTTTSASAETSSGKGRLKRAALQGRKIEAAIVPKVLEAIDRGVEGVGQGTQAVGEGLRELASSPAKLADLATRWARGEDIRSMYGLSDADLTMLQKNNPDLFPRVYNPKLSHLVAQTRPTASATKEPKAGGWIPNIPAGVAHQYGEAIDRNLRPDQYPAVEGETATVAKMEEAVPAAQPELPPEPQPPTPQFKRRTMAEIRADVAQKNALLREATEKDRLAREQEIARSHEPKPNPLVKTLTRAKQQFKTWFLGKKKVPGQTTPQSPDAALHPEPQSFTPETPMQEKPEEAAQTPFRRRTMAEIRADVARENALLRDEAEKDRIARQQEIAKRLEPKPKK